MAAQALTTPRAPVSSVPERDICVCSWLTASKQNLSASLGVIGFVDMPTPYSDRGAKTGQDGAKVLPACRRARPGKRSFNPTNCTPSHNRGVPPSVAKER